MDEFTGRDGGFYVGESSAALDLGRDPAGLSWRVCWPEGVFTGLEAVVHRGVRQEALAGPAADGLDRDTGGVGDLLGAHSGLGHGAECSRLLSVPNYSKWFL